MLPAPNIVHGSISLAVVTTLWGLVATASAFLEIFRASSTPFQDLPYRLNRHLGLVGPALSLTSFVLGLYKPLDDPACLLTLVLAALIAWRASQQAS